MDIRGTGVGESFNKSKKLRKFQRVQRMMNIKIAKAFRKMSHEASCVMAAFGQIQLAVQEKERNYTATHNNIEYDDPVDVSYWPQTLEMPLVRATTEIPNNAINIFTDASKIEGKLGAAAIIIRMPFFFINLSTDSMTDAPIIRQNR